MAERYTIFDDNLKLFESMMEDMANAKRSIYIETFRFGKDAMGERFRMVLYQKAKEGIAIKLLLDAWGTGTDLSFFQPLIDVGVEIRMFRKFRLTKGVLAKNHCRNHRKLLLVDSEIGYMGSANITAYSISWKELNLRTTDHSLLKVFRRSFRDSYRNYNKYDLPVVASYKTYSFNDWIFIQDYPDSYRQRIKRKYEALIRSAQKEVIIETPYFLPGHVLRKEMMEAAKRGVDVKVLIPRSSDVRVVDIIRRHYLGKLHEAGIKFYFYEAGNLHAKSVQIDGQTFCLSSANFDYRSFRYQYEIALLGKKPAILNQLKEHYEKTIELCGSFDYDSWEQRAGVEKLIEFILLPFRYLM